MNDPVNRENSAAAVERSKHESVNQANLPSRLVSRVGLCLPIDSGSSGRKTSRTLGGQETAAPVQLYEIPSRPSADAKGIPVTVSFQRARVWMMKAHSFADTYELLSDAEFFAWR